MQPKFKENLLPLVKRSAQTAKQRKKTKEKRIRLKRGNLSNLAIIETILPKIID